MKVYWSSIEYSYNNESDQFGKLKGGMVYAFINAIDAIDALDKILSALKNENLDPIDVEFVSPYDVDMEWEDSEQTSNFLELFNESKNNDEVIFDAFYAYEED